MVACIQAEVQIAVLDCREEHNRVIFCDMTGLMVGGIKMEQRTTCSLQC